MSGTRQEQSHLPGWLCEALEEAEVPDEPLDRRAELRRVWAFLCHLTPAEGQNGTPCTVRVTDVSSGGVGFISRQELHPGYRFQLVPVGREDEEALHVRIVHCMQIVQGYNVGCSIESS